MSLLKKKEGADVVDDIYSKSSTTNYGIWYLKATKKSSILKLQESGPGGFADVKRALDENKVQFFLFRVTVIEVKSGENSTKRVSSKFVRGYFTGVKASRVARGNAFMMQADAFKFLKNAHKSYQFSAIADLNKEVIEEDLRVVNSGGVQKFDFSNVEVLTPSPKMKTKRLSSKLLKKRSLLWSSTSPKSKSAAAASSPEAEARARRAEAETRDTIITRAIVSPTSRTHRLSRKLPKFSFDGSAPQDLKIGSSPAISGAQSISEKAEAPDSATSAASVSSKSAVTTATTSTKEKADEKAAATTATKSANEKTDEEAALPKPLGESADVLKLVYFDVHGRGEAIRLILTAGGVDFEDERLGFEEWGKLRADPESVPSRLNGTLPVLTHGDFKLGQSRAIQTYAAAIALPSTRTTPKAVAIDSMFQNNHGDVQTELFKCLFEQDEGRREAAKAKMNESVAPYMEAIERNIPESGFIKGGDIPSAADIVMFDLGTSTLPDMKDLGVDLSNYPKFNALVAKVGAYPPIAKYVASRR